MKPYQELLAKYILAVFPMSLQKCNDIVEHFSYKEIAKNELYLREGQISQEYCFVVEGFMRSFTYDVEGNEVTTNFVSQNQLMVDLASFFKRIPAQENIQALTQCRVLYVTFEQIQFLFHSMPEFRELGRTFLVNFNVQLKQRMLSMIQQTAEQRYATLMKSNPEILQNAPLKQIASYLGITDTSLSRIRKELSRTGH